MRPMKNIPTDQLPTREIPLTLVKGNLTTRYLHKPGCSKIWGMLLLGWEIKELRRQAL